jgi:hypothetical protein
METNLREYDVFIVTNNNKIFIGNIFTISPQQAKIKAMALNSTKPIIKSLIEDKTDYSVIAELSDTRCIFK